MAATVAVARFLMRMPPRPPVLQPLALDALSTAASTADRRASGSSAIAGSTVSSRFTSSRIRVASSNSRFWAACATRCAKDWFRKNTWIATRQTLERDVQLTPVSSNCMKRKWVTEKAAGKGSPAACLGLTGCCYRAGTKVHCCLAPPWNGRVIAELSLLPSWASR